MPSRRPPSHARRSPSRPAGSHFRVHGACRRAPPRRAWRHAPEIRAAAAQHRRHRHRGRDSRDPGRPAAVALAAGLRAAAGVRRPHAAVGPAAGRPARGPQRRAGADGGDHAVPAVAVPAIGRPADPQRDLGGDDRKRLGSAPCRAGAAGGEPGGVVDPARRRLSQRADGGGSARLLPAVRGTDRALRPQRGGLARCAGAGQCRPARHPCAARRRHPRCRAPADGARAARRGRPQPHRAAAEPARTRCRPGAGARRNAANCAPRRPPPRS